MHIRFVNHRYTAMGGVYSPEMSREVKEEDLAEALRSAHRNRSP